MEHLIANITAVGRPRRSMLNGRRHLVVPVSMIVPGVLDGSQGPILYTKEENEKSVTAWNGVPITVEHPITPTGDAISARDPEVLNKQGIGTVLNTKSNGKLTAEAWLDIQNTSRVDNRIIDQLERGKPIELSTGLFMDTEPAPAGAVHNGKSYSFIARNFRPDHLALLPDSVGACSLKDGCGVLVNKGMSHDEVRNILDEMLRANFTQDEAPPFVEDVFDDFMIFSHNGKLFRQAFNTKDGKISLSNRKPKEVTRKVDFVPVANREKSMAKKELVDALISNCSCWSEDDRETLDQMGDDKVQSLVDNAKGQKESAEKLERNQAVVDAVKSGFKVGNDEFTINKKGEMVKKEPEPKQDPVTNSAGTSSQKPDAKNVEDRLTPEEMEDLAFARNERNRQKQEVITKLTVNVADDSKEALLQVLNTKSIDELRVMLALAPSPSANETKPPANYVGAAAPIGNTSAAVDRKAILPLPTINWAEERKQA